MRLVFAITLLSGTIALAQPTEGKPVEARFGVAPKLKTYPQDTAKKALSSAIQAIRNDDTAYLLAHLVDPRFVDSRLSDRAKQYEADVELRLSRLRDLQIRNREAYRPEERIPTDRAKFLALIVEESRKEGFKQLARDVAQKVLDDPESFRDMRKLLLSGKFEETPTGVKVTHADVKFRALYLQRIGDRWFLENRQEELLSGKKGSDQEPAKGPGM